MLPQQDSLVSIYAEIYDDRRFGGKNVGTALTNIDHKVSKIHQKVGDETLSTTHNLWRFERNIPMAKWMKANPFHHKSTPSDI